MRLFAYTWISIFALNSAVALTTLRHEQSPLHRGDENGISRGISLDLFTSFERLSRLVDITYCVGTTGIRKPFSCISRCKDFPSLELVTTWNTGALLSDSCGYIAVEHGTQLNPEPESGRNRAKDGGSIIVAFRGTYSITNTVVDLSTVPQKYVPYPPPNDEDGSVPEEPTHRCLNCTVHMGFLTSWQLAKRTVLPQLKQLHEQYPDHVVHVIGHSLGGAVGALAALELKVIFGWDNLIVTTFGEPRVGNKGFVQYLNTAFGLDDKRIHPTKQIYRRITHTEDPVPLLPLSEWGYRSHAGEFFISRAALSPEPSDIRPCIGDYDPECIAGSEGEPVPNVNDEMNVEKQSREEASSLSNGIWHVPARFKLWELLFAHRDYFWRLGLCVPGGDPIDWGRDRYPQTGKNDEL
ncbi:alpha/beta-hydrolase [Xylariaceae sp. FL0255]|nr:alpha/beta-hydrolase [Xylariaceae sp. FL0255]